MHHAHPGVEWGDHCNHCNHSKKHNSNHLSVHQWIRSAIHASQQFTSPIASYPWNFRHRLARHYWYYMTDFASTSGPQFETIAQLFSQLLWLQPLWDGFVIPQITSYWGSSFNGVLTSSIGRVACLRFGAGLLVPCRVPLGWRCKVLLGCWWCRCRVLLSEGGVRCGVWVLVQL